MKKFTKICLITALVLAVARGGFDRRRHGVWCLFSEIC